jgi:methanogenic corrinoid protein MtbC1
VRQALDSGIDPNRVLDEGLMRGMDRIGVMFGERQAYVPQLLLSARAMTKGLDLLKPFFQSGEAKHRGQLVLGVVEGDLHDIGKNLVRMMVEGAGWEVIDLGIDQKPKAFVKAVDKNPGCAVGVGTLLTSTMGQMEKTVRAIKKRYPETVVVLGGAPLSQGFAEAIGADRYLHDAHAAGQFFAAK